MFPLGIGYLAAVLEREGHEIKAIDCTVNDSELLKNEDGTFHAGLTWQKIKKEIEHFCPDVVGVSCLWTADYPNAKKISEIVKEIDDIPVIFGGAHTTALPKEVLSNKTIDYVVIGEGELVLPRLLRNIKYNDSLSKIGGIGYKLEGKLIINLIKEYISDLDKLPFPARHLFPMDDYLSAKNVHNYIFKRQPQGANDYFKRMSARL